MSRNLTRRRRVFPSLLQMTTIAHQSQIATKNASKLRRERLKVMATLKEILKTNYLFATVGKPKFLDRPLEDEDVDWNSLSKRYEPLFEYSSVSCPAESVDLSSAERTEASVSGAPVKYKREISETTRHMFLHGKRSVDMSNVTDGTSVAGTAQGMRKIELMGGITLEKCKLWVLGAGDHNLPY